MAKNYTITQAVEIITEGKNTADMAEIGRRFPLLAQKIAVVSAKAGDSFVDLMKYMPEDLSANRVNNVIKKMLGTGAESDTDEVDEPAETEGKKEEKKPAVKEKKAAGNDYESMTGKELITILRERKLAKECEAKYGLKKDGMVRFLTELENGVDDSDDEDEQDDAVDYSKMSPVELFKECKKRGIEAEQKKPAKYYINLLKKDDEANEQEDDDWNDEDEGWEDEPKGKPAKPAKPAKETKPAAKGKPAKPAAKKEEEDDDENWDI